MMLFRSSIQSDCLAVICFIVLRRCSELNIFEITDSLLQILEDRYGRQAIIVTSQLPVSKWYGVINDPTLADALLDRLTANAHRIELEGEALRRKKS